MPKKRIIGTNEIINNTSATAKLTYDIDASSNTVTMFFNQGGTSFVLEDAEGSRVRFWYITTSTQGYFESDNNLQPRYFNNDSSNDYFVFDSDNPFFGEKSSDPNSIVNQFYQGTPLRINISDLHPGQNLTKNAKESDTNTFRAVIAEVVKRTVRAINYADEIKISAEYELSSDGLVGYIYLTQIIKGPEGNTSIDRNINADSDTQNFYGILTDDIVTQDFSGGAINPSTYENIFSERSGSLSNSIKKEVNRKSFLPGLLPSNKTTTGRKLTRESVIFDDKLTCVFENKSNINTIFGLPITEAVIDGKEELFFTYSNIDENIIYDSTDNKFLNEHLLLRNTSIFSKPNKLNFQTFIKPDDNSQSEENKLIRIKMGNDSLDKFIDQKRIVEEYYPYKEDFGQFIAEGSDFETKNIENDLEYNIKNQKQIKISLNFPDVDAYLVNTAIAYNEIDDSIAETDDIHYTGQINFLSGHKKAVSSKSLPTAYWNFIDNRWEYLDIKSTNLSSTGYVDSPASDPNYVYKSKVFPATVNHNSFSINAGEYDFRESVKNNLLNRPICLSPSFRENSNNSFLMQPTTSHGFPQKVNWQPHNNHIMKMSEYIDENFIVEKVIISGKLSANFEKPLKQGNYGPGTLSSLSDFQQDYSLKQLSNDYLSSIESLGFSFFILNQRKNADVVNKKALISKSSFYTEALKSSFDPTSELIVNSSDNIYSESTFLNNTSISPVRGEHGIYQFDNKHTDFYKINTSNNTLNFDLQFKNKFYHLDNTSSLSSNKYEQLLYKDITAWDESNFNENLTSGTINKFNIVDSYSEGVSQEDVSRELVSFSNLLIVNDSANSISSSNSINLKNIDEVIYIDNSTNSVENTKFTIKSYLKNYESSNFIDESKYSLLSNKNNTYVSRSGTKAKITLKLDFSYTFFSGSLINFVNAIDGFSFSLNCPERFHLKLENNPSENDTIYVQQELASYKNFFNLSKLDSNIWKTTGTESDAAFNFSYFILQLVGNINQTQNFSNLVFFDNSSFDQKVGRIYLSSFVNSFSSQEDKSVNLTFEGESNGTAIFSIFGGVSSYVAVIHEENNPVCTEVIFNSSSIGISDVNKTDVLSNDIKILEGFSKGKENFLGINSERLINKVDIDSNNITQYSNEIGYSFFEENTKNSVVKSKYLLKPEDELIFGINSYGNGDLIASFLALHESLDITIIGHDQSKDTQLKNNESKSIRRLIKESNKRRTNIEGTNFTKNNYFSKIFNTNNFKSNKRIIGSTSSNEFGNWGGFVNLEEVNSSRSINNSNPVYRKYYYDSILPNFIDIFKTLNNKSPLEDDNNLTFIIDDSILSDDPGFSSGSASNKNKILFKDEWLNNFVFDSILSPSLSNQINDIRNINNTIESSIAKHYDRNKIVNININENSYSLNAERAEDVSIGNYTLPYTSTTSNHRIPSKIYNNSTYDFIESDKNIGIQTIGNLLDNYEIKFSIQKPAGFSKWLLVVHDENQVLENNEYPIYNAFKSYFEQGINDFEVVTKLDSLNNITSEHLISSREIPLTLHIPSFFIGFSFTPFKSFSKKFKVYYETKTDGTSYDLNNQNVEDYLLTRKFFAELEYWEIAELEKSFSASNDRLDSFGGTNSGFAYSSSIYSSNDSFIGTNLKNVAEESKLLFDNVGEINFKKIYDLNQEIESTGQNFEIQSADCNCNVSISRYTLSNEKSSKRPVLEKELQESFKFKDSASITNTIQTYIDKSYLEDNVEKIINLDSEFDSINTKSQDILLNEKIYESDVYFLSPVITNGAVTGLGNIKKTKTKVIFKYIKNENSLDFPYMKFLSMKTKSNFLKTKFNKKDSCIFLPKIGKLRIYEQSLLDIYNSSQQISFENIPYFEISLYDDVESDISFDSKKVTLANLNNSGFLFPEDTRGSKIFSIESNKNEEWESNEERDRNINNFIYTFGKDHNMLPLERCGGFKFGVLNGHKTSPSYKFNAYNYGQFADFIPYSTNAAYVKKDLKATRQLIEYPVEKVFVDTYYNVVSTGSNTYNKDAYSRFGYPYIENNDNQLSQLNSNNPLYNDEYSF